MNKRKVIAASRKTHMICIGSMDGYGIVTVPFTKNRKNRQINSVIVSQHGTISTVLKIEDGVETIDFLRFSDSDEDIAEDIIHFIQNYAISEYYDYDNLEINLSGLFDFFQMDKPIGLNITTVNYTPKLICGSATPPRRANDIFSHFDMEQYMSIDFDIPIPEYKIDA